MSAEHPVDSDLRHAQVLAVVRAIGAGEVMSYGAVARRAGWPRHARFVARVLAASDDPQMPWHRVVRADGRLGFAPESPQWCVQRDRLRSEGIELGQLRARLAAPRAVADLDAVLWGADGTADPQCGGIQ